MRTKFSNIYLLAVLLIVATFGCSDMESIHEEYLQGEKIYAGKLDSLEVFTGYKRVKIVGLTNFLGYSNECTVAWEGNSMVFPIEASTNKTFEMIVDSLEERSYEFTVSTKDDMGNESVSQTTTGRAVGDIFKSTQRNRRITEIKFVDDNTFVNWADQDESQFVIFTKLSYENNNGEMTTVIVNADDSQTLLENWKPLGRLESSSAIISGELGFDTIYLDTNIGALPAPPYDMLDKGKLTLVGMQSDNPGTSYGADPVQYLFDGDGSWTGSDAYGYHSGENAIPHHFTIDLGVTARVRKCRLDLRDPNNYAGNNPTAVEIWGIMDISNAETSGSNAAEFEEKGWQLLYRGRVDGQNNQSVEFEIPRGPIVRYLRYRVTETVGGSGAQLTEMTFWGQDIQPIDVSVNAMITVNHENPGGPDAGEGSLKLIDGDLNSKFLIFDYPDKNPLHIQQELPQEEIVTSYTLTSGNDAPDRDPKNWMLLGSNSGTDWDVLDTRNNQIFTERNQTVKYDFTSETAYKYYVLAITSNNGGGLFQLSEWRLYR